MSIDLTSFDGHSMDDWNNDSLVSLGENIENRKIQRERRHGENREHGQKPN